jgi:DNA-directed RNA polymerase specialized sigma24 family protein
MDPVLVRRAQGGDEVAFAAIAQAAHGRFKQVAFRILRDRHLAEDAMQQALMDIWRKLPRLRDPERFDAWSYRFLVHACYAEAKRQRVGFGDLPPAPIALGDTGLVNDRDQLERGFARLSLEHRAVLVLRYYLDLSVDEVAEALGISPGTAKSRLNRARAKLRLALHADEPGIGREFAP